jgi:hypothetical protein
VAYDELEIIVNCRLETAFEIETLFTILESDGFPILANANNRRATAKVDFLLKS